MIKLHEPPPQFKSRPIVAIQFFAHGRLVVSVERDDGETVRVDVPWSAAASYREMQMAIARRTGGCVLFRDPQLKKHGNWRPFIREMFDSYCDRARGVA